MRKVTKMLCKFEKKWEKLTYLFEVGQKESLYDYNLKTTTKQFKEGQNRSWGKTNMHNSNWEM